MSSVMSGKIRKQMAQAIEMLDTILEYRCFDRVEYRNKLTEIKEVFAAELERNTAQERRKYNRRYAAAKAKAAAGDKRAAGWLAAEAGGAQRAAFDRRVDEHLNELAEKCLEMGP